MNTNNNTAEEQRIITRIASLNGHRNDPKVIREIAQLHRELERIDPEKWGTVASAPQHMGLQVTVTLHRIQ